MLAALNEASQKPSRSQAIVLAGQILSCYRHQPIPDADAFQMAMAAVLSAYPADLARLVANPVTGIASRLKFLPSIAEVRDALEAEDGKRRLIAENARWTIAERARRISEAKERAEFEERNRADRARIESQMAADPERFQTATQVREEAERARAERRLDIRDSSPEVAIPVGPLPKLSQAALDSLAKRERGLF